MYAVEPDTESLIGAVSATVFLICWLLFLLEIGNKMTLIYKLYEIAGVITFQNPWILICGFVVRIRFSYSLHLYQLFPLESCLPEFLYQPPNNGLWSVFLLRHFIGLLRAETSNGMGRAYAPNLCQLHSVHFYNPLVAHVLGMLSEVHRWLFCGCLVF